MYGLLLPLLPLLLLPLPLLPKCVLVPVEGYCKPFKLGEEGVLGRPVGRCALGMTGVGAPLPAALFPPFATLAEETA
jgi:hypothetical protein